MSEQCINFTAIVPFPPFFFFARFAASARLAVTRFAVAAFAVAAFAVAAFATAATFALLSLCVFS